MNKNSENYKQAMNQVHASDELKERTLEKAKKQKKSASLIFLRYATSIAAVAIVAFVGISIYNNNPKENLTAKSNKISKEFKNEQLEKYGIKRFSSTDELKKAIKKSGLYRANGNYYETKGEFLDTAVEESESVSDNSNSRNIDYSKTNNQVENVDEADIVKTDGEYIYYVNGEAVYIINSKNLDIQSKIIIDNFRPINLFINDNKMVVLGNYHKVVEGKDEQRDEEYDYRYLSYYNYEEYAKAIVYDISDKENPNSIREVALEGGLSQARMIGDNVYFIANKWLYYGIDEIKDEDILPKYIDSRNSSDEQMVKATDIAYFGEINQSIYSMIAGFNINNNESANIETFLGVGYDVYVSENNMYIIQTDSNYYRTRNDSSSTIYKFKLDNGFVTAVAKGNVPGYINDQFSLDEYEGNLRIVTTIYSYEEHYENPWDDGFYLDENYTTQLTVFDEDLKQIGVIKDLKKDERVYAVRFIGKVGYVVTYEQVDPLFVIDLSDPTNPVVKGELEIPGYSAYLHPIDETHIIGIGYNTKPNGYGGMTTDNLKMSMFDVSDLENPKELFKIDIGKNYSYSQIMYEHKALFYKASEGLIGFPAQWYDGVQYSGLALFKIDLENNQFIEITDLMDKGYNNYSSILRAIYIDNILYTLSYNQIISYELDTFEKLNQLDLKDDRVFDHMVVE